jgi:hypothetical protein
MRTSISACFDLVVIEAAFRVSIIPGARQASCFNLTASANE